MAFRSIETMQLERRHAGVAPRLLARRVQDQPALRGQRSLLHLRMIEGRPGRLLGDHLVVRRVGGAPIAQGGLRELVALERRVAIGQQGFRIEVRRLRVVPVGGRRRTGRQQDRPAITRGYRARIRVVRIGRAL